LTPKKTKQNKTKQTIMSIIYTNSANPSIDIRETFGHAMRYETMSRISDLKQTAGERTWDWDFPVKQERLKTESGKPTPIQAVVRKDTGEYVGDYRSESLVSNQSIHDAVVAELSRQGMEDVPMEPQIFNNGSRVMMTYNLSGESSLDGEVFSSHLQVKNSYDGSWKLSASLMMRRLACLNGMYVSQGETILSKRHSADLDASALTKFLGDSLTNRDNELDDLRRLKDEPLELNHAFNICSNAARMSKGSLGLPIATRIMTNYISPSLDEEGQGDTWWRLYNAGTRVFRDLQPIQAKVANDARRWFCDALLLAMHPERGHFAKNAKNELTSTPLPDWDITKAKPKKEEN
jgi:hypothetical protein